MPREKTPEEAYDELVTRGLYEEANPDKDEIGKVIRLAIEDYEFGKGLREISNPNWRVIFNINYDVLRELCDQLMRFKRQKISNHQGLFAFIILHFPELELDWTFFETIRGMRNQNKYMGADITRDMWKKMEMQTDLYISTLKKEIEKRLKSV
ncbi:MAG: hypothetical protein NT001_02915 [Candidatus Woesearchaeota archaeon]|nr:hypothetical protein [Candidatus Woesearchaeota archaeon]